MSTNKQILYSSIITFVFLLLGFLLLHYNLIGYGVSFFVFLPFTLGIVLGNRIIKTTSIIGLVLSLILFCILLYLGQLEGMICLLMALPIIIVSIAVGMLISSIVRKNKKPKDDSKLLSSIVVPFGIFLVLGITENHLINNDESTNSISTTMILPHSTMEVYDAIKNVDTLDTQKPFLMKLDLPIPQKCILSEEKVGALRTCYFKEGTIVEKVTKLEKGKALEMDVIEYNLPGRKWLGFKRAIYKFEKIDENHSKITRVTTYTSELKPRFYWKPLEKIGIEQEHEYVLRNLAKDLWE